MPNRLAGETSPYLLQHAGNPVDWYPWGAEALATSKAQDKPIFLSIGYSACHWCHVMEHESFEDEQIARRLSENFIAIKVDREERPDLDHIYMLTVQMMTGQGGWPMSVFLTPELQPFYGGTYWPPRARMGMPGFEQVLSAVLDAWNNRRDEAIRQAAAITAQLQQMNTAPASDARLNVELLHAAGAALERTFDFNHGGFRGAPKFPQPASLRLLLRIWHHWPRDGVLQMVKLSLDKMAQGGIYDHLAGGFARYSVDERWLVPHFEKMLYDNALLADAYLDGYLATGNSQYARVASQTLDYLLNDMTDPHGGFHSTEDADSEGEEGKFYVWTPEEVQQILGEEAAATFCYVYDVSGQGNFEGKSILNLPKTVEQCAAIKGWDLEKLGPALAESRRKLLAVRDGRVRPGKDDKVLLSWNALAIDSLARAAGILDEPAYLAAATKAAQFIHDSMSRPDGRLFHCWRGGRAKHDACLDDYTYLINALVTLYEAGFEERWIDEAVSLADIVLRHFADSQHGGFFYTADDHESLITRPKEVQDSSVPSGNAMAATGLVRLGRLCGRTDYLEAARSTLTATTSQMSDFPNNVAQMLIALDAYLGPMPEIVLLGDPHQRDTRAAIADLRKRFLPNRIVACRTGAESGGDSRELDPIFAGKQMTDAALTVFVCEDFACQAPVTGKDAALATWETLAAIENAKP